VPCTQATPRPLIASTTQALAACRVHRGSLHTQHSHSLRALPSHSPHAQHSQSVHACYSHSCTPQAFAACIRQLIAAHALHSHSLTFTPQTLAAFTPNGRHSGHAHHSHARAVSDEQLLGDTQVATLAFSWQNVGHAFFSGWLLAVHERIPSKMLGWCCLCKVYFAELTG
jgi:hypothetical protein